jgi:hypothetical protein
MCLNLACRLIPKICPLRLRLSLLTNSNAQGRHTNCKRRPPTGTGHLLASHAQPGPPLRWAILCGRGYHRNLLPLNLPDCGRYLTVSRYDHCPY